MDILRFITAGNVDDGKSTLIGRLLYDTDNIKTDELYSITTDTGKASDINLAFITDGLRAERQQGITIDVAYKYFTTRHRKYIITDAPGHFQYTRNLVAGASGVDAMIILIDAENGITDQTKRHSLVASFLSISQVAVIINKMDLVGYDEAVFISIKNEFLAIAAELNLDNVTFIPVSALHGDNVSFPSQKMEWYKGKTFMQYLENCTPASFDNDAMRLSIQYVIDTGGGESEKGYAGKLLSGTLKTGNEISIYPKGHRSIIRKIIHNYNEVKEAHAQQNICVYLEDDASAHRGDIIAFTQNAPLCSNKFEASICWLNMEKQLQTGKEYFLRINSEETTCKIMEVVHKIDVSTLKNYNDDKMVEVNQFAKVRIETKDMIVYDPYSVLRENGRGIIIDPQTNYTSGAFVILF